MAKPIPKIGSRRNRRIGSRKNARRVPKGVRMEDNQLVTKQIV